MRLDSQGTVYVSSNAEVSYKGTSSGTVPMCPEGRVWGSGYGTQRVPSMNVAEFQRHFRTRGKKVLTLRLGGDLPGQFCQSLYVVVVVAVAVAEGG